MQEWFPMLLSRLVRGVYPDAFSKRSLLAGVKMPDLRHILRRSSSLTLPKLYKVLWLNDIIGKTKASAKLVYSAKLNALRECRTNRHHSLVVLMILHHFMSLNHHWLGWLCTLHDVKTLNLVEIEVLPALYQSGISVSRRESEGRVTVENIVPCSAEFLEIFSEHMPVSKWYLILRLQFPTLLVAFGFWKDVCFRWTPGRRLVALF